MSRPALTDADDEEETSKPVKPGQKIDLGGGGSTDGKQPAPADTCKC